MTLSLGIYYLVAPEKFKEELNIRNRDAMTEQVEGAQPGEGALNDILDGIPWMCFRSTQRIAKAKRTPRPMKRKTQLPRRRDNPKGNKAPPVVRGMRPIPKI